MDKPYVSLFIPIEPAPASRPIVAKYGTRYSKSHMAYRDACDKYLAGLDGLPPPLMTEQLTVTLLFRCTKARTSRLVTPRYDIDNLCKLPLDCMTSSGLFWRDDVQISQLLGVKRFRNETEEAGTKVLVDIYP